MKQTYFSLLFLSLCLAAMAAASGLYAQSRSLPILELNPDARTAAMGNLLMGDARSTAIYVNPASVLYAPKHWRADFSATLFPQDKEVGRQMFYQASVSSQLWRRHALLGGFRYLGGQHFSVVNGAGEEAPKVVKPFHWTLDLAYAYRMNESWSFFVQGAFIESYTYSHAYASSWSLGANYRWLLEPGPRPAVLNLACRLADIGPAVSYGKGGRYALPSSLQLNAHWQKSFSEQHGLGVQLGSRYFFLPSKAKLVQAGLGAEYSYRQRYSLRAGYRYGSRHSSMFTAGAGIALAGISVDIAYLHALGELGANHCVVGIGYSF